jgi:hypothetical protein
MNKNQILMLPVAMLVLPAASGCDSGDARLARMSEDAASRQADQNREIAHLVETQQALQRGLDDERGKLDQQRTLLEDERRAIASQRIRDPIIANALVGAVILAACALPLILAFFVHRSSCKAEASDTALTELLVQEIVADEPVLLPKPQVPALREPRPAGETPSCEAGGMTLCDRT